MMRQSTVSCTPRLYDSSWKARKSYAFVARRWRVLQFRWAQGRKEGQEKWPGGQRKGIQKKEVGIKRRVDHCLENWVLDVLFHRIYINRCPDILSLCLVPHWRQAVLSEEVLSVNPGHLGILQMCRLKLFSHHRCLIHGAQIREIPQIVRQVQVCPIRQRLSSSRLITIDRALWRVWNTSGPRVWNLLTGESLYITSHCLPLPGLPPPLRCQFLQLEAQAP